MGKGSNQDTFISVLLAILKETVNRSWYMYQISLRNTDFPHFSRTKEEFPNFISVHTSNEREWYATGKNSVQLYRADSYHKLIYTFNQIRKQRRMQNRLYKSPTLFQPHNFNMKTNTSLHHTSLCIS